VLFQKSQSIILTLINFLNYQDSLASLNDAFSKFHYLLNLKFYLRRQYEFKKQLNHSKIRQINDLKSICVLIQFQVIIH